MVFVFKIQTSLMLEHCTRSVTLKYIYFIVPHRRSPVSVAAAAIYLASQASEDKKSQKGKKSSDN